MLGNYEQEKEYESIKKEVLQELKKDFRPEFLNRVDEIIVFHKLNNEEIGKIVDIMLKDVIIKLQQQNITLDVDKTAKTLIIKKGTDTTYGARPLRRAIQTLLEDKIAEEILDGRLKNGNKAKAVAKDEQIQIDIV